MPTRHRSLVLSMLLFAAGVLTGLALRPEPVAGAQGARRVFEIRTYTAHEGRLEALHGRFRNHTMRYFEKHGMTNVGYWSPQDAPRSQDTLIYILAHPSREAAEKNWAAFRADPDWLKARAASEANGPLVAKSESIFMDATDFSPMK
jgi:hypothetical protein